jgi:hypothetical protein
MLPDTRNNNRHVCIKNLLCREKLKEKEFKLQQALMD